MSYLLVYCLMLPNGTIDCVRLADIAQPVRNEVECLRLAEDKRKDKRVRVFCVPQPRT